MPLVPLLTILVVADTTRAFHVPVALAESVRVSAAGSGEPVVLLPGLFGSAYAYRDLVPLLDGAGYRAIVVEPLGVGRSARPAGADYSLAAQADRVAVVLDTLRLSAAVVVAHAVGVAVALRLAYRRPDLVRGVVALDGGPAESATTPGFRRALRLEPVLRLLGVGAIRGRIRRQLREASGNASWVTDEVVAGYTAAAAADLGATLGAYRAMARSAEPEALAPRLSEIRAPVLLLVGGVPHEGGPSPREVRLLAERLPVFAVDSLPGVGHFVHEEAPAAVVNAVAAVRVAAQALRSTADAAHRAAGSGETGVREPEP